MNHLKSLNFTTVPKGSANPTLNRRAKLTERLEEQKALAKDPSFTVATKRWKKGADGIKQLVETKRPIKPWWRTDVTGATVLTVRYGFKTIEFEKGKPGIAIPAKEKLAGVIDTIIAAVRSGELDSILAQHGAGRGASKAKNAA